MRPTECFEAVSAGVLLDGEVAVLSFITNAAVNDREASVVLSLDMLRMLERSIRATLDQPRRRKTHRA